MLFLKSYRKNTTFAIMKKSFLYTRTGDEGMTSLVGGTRIAKHSPRVSAYGEVDELNAHIGLVRAYADMIEAASDDSRLLQAVSARLFDIGSHLATPFPSGKEIPVVISDGDIRSLEDRIDYLDNLLPPQRTFILPGGCVASSEAHVARTVCRRAERAILSFVEESGERVEPRVLRYINRLSDYLFILARAMNHYNGVSDIPWEKA